MSNEQVIVIDCPRCFSDTKLVIQAPMLPGRTGPHWCLSCNRGFTAIIDDTGRLGCEHTHTRLVIQLLILLKFVENIHDKPVYFVLRDMKYCTAGEHPSIEELNDSMKFYYEEHLCPANFMDTTILHGDNEDPHHLFEHVQTIEWPMPEFWQSIGVAPCPTTREKRFNHNLTFDQLKALFNKME